jgi:hypothetical protein
MHRELLAEQAIVLTLAIVDVANDRTRDVFQVSAHLMQPTSQRVYLYQAIAAENLAAAEFGLCGHTRGVGVLPGRQRVIDHPDFRRHSAHQGHVGLGGSTLGKRLANSAGHLGGEGEEQHTAGGSIQSVNGKNRNTELLAQTGRGHLALARPAAMDRQPGGLVDSHEIIVSVEQRQRISHEAQRISKVVSQCLMIECKLCQVPGCSRIPSCRRRTFLHCSACGLVFVPASEWLTIEAERARYDHHDNTRMNPGYLRFLDEVVAQVEALQVGTASILDYGCGGQAVLTGLLRDKGMSCIGYDPIYGRDQLGGPHALVILCEVIEHLRDLRGELARVGRLLGPGGRVLLRTRLHPGIAAMADWWYARDATHINFIGEETLARAAGLAGCNTVVRVAGDMFVWKSAPLRTHLELLGG